MQQPPNDEQPYSQQVPPLPYQQPYYPPPMTGPPKRKRRRWLWIVLGIIGFLLFACIGLGSLASTLPSSTTTIPTSTTSVQATDTPVPTDTPIPTSTLVPTPTPQLIHYPPTTEADLRGLAAEGDASAIHEFHSESVGALGACPQPKREVTVDPRVTGRQLAEDLLAYFYGQQLDSPCGSIVFAYHNQGEANDVYTAGRVNFDVYDSSGQYNLDPNATNLTYTLTLDVGGFSTGQEYVVTY